MNKFKIFFILWSLYAKGYFFCHVINYFFGSGIFLTALIYVTILFVCILMIIGGLILSGKMICASDDVDFDKKIIGLCAGVCIMLLGTMIFLPELFII